MRLAAAALLLAHVAVARAAPPASPLLPPDHWAMVAADRLEALGLVAEWMPAQRAAPVLAVAAALAEAEERAGRDRPDLLPLVRAWRARFQEEWRRAPRSTDGEERQGEGIRSPSVPGLVGAQLGAGAQGGRSREAPGPPAAGPAALHLQTPRTDPFLEARAAATATPYLAAGAELRALPWLVELPSAEVVAAAGPAALSAGRARVAYGPGQLGGVVFGGAQPLDRVELMTAEPFRLPWLLRHLGLFAADGFVARVNEPRHPYHPLLSGVQLQWRPFQRLTFSASRGLIFGGALWSDIPAGKVPGVLLGVSNYRENNVAAYGARLRLPTEAVLPLTARLEWGGDDNGGAVLTVPGIVAGLSTPAVPGTSVAVGVEYAYLGRICCRDIQWYTHGQYTGGWAVRDLPLGDMLGGDGRALRVLGSVDPWDARLHLGATAAVQDRFSQNLHAPQAAGRSASLDGRAEVRFERGALELRGAFERGHGWSRGEGRLAVKLFL